MTLDKRTLWTRRDLMRGLSAVDVNMLQLFQSVHTSKWKVLVKLRWPTSLPYLFAGLRITASASMVGAIIVEWINSDTGLGYMIINSTYQLKTAVPGGREARSGRFWPGGVGRAVACSVGPDGRDRGVRTGG